MAYDIDSFVNGNAASLSLLFDKYNGDDKAAAAQEVRLFETFKEMVNYDKEIDLAQVYVYELNGVPVAWYDADLFVGYIVDTRGFY